MAKKIKAAKGGKEVIVIDGAAAIAEYKGQTLQQLGKAAAELGSNGNAKGIAARLCGIAFAAGRAARAKKIAKYDFGAEYQAFSEPFYRGRKAPDPKTEKVYISNYGAFAEAGLKAWDAEPVAIAALSVQGSAAKPVTMSWRAGKVRKLLENEAAPTKETIAEALEIKAPKRNNKPGRNMKGRLAGLLNSIDSYAEKDFVVAMTTTFGSSMGTALRELFEAAHAARVELAKMTKDADAKAKATKAAAALATAIKAMPAPAGRRMQA